MDNRNILQSQLELPFKPFTADEVVRITGCSAKQLEAFSTRQVWRIGEDRRTVGLEWVQTFAVFVGVKWLHEGAPTHAALDVVEFLSETSVKTLGEELEAGNMWPVPARPENGLRFGTFVRTPKGLLGNRLNLGLLYREFLANIKRVFPNG